MHFDSLAANTEAALNTLSEAAGGVHPAETRTFAFRTGALVPGQAPVALVQEVGDWTGAAPGRYVYYFETDADEPALAALHCAVSDARENKRADRKYARLFGPNKILYVGSSSSLPTRFRQHLGYGNKAVFAMQLAYWANCCDVLVRFSAARYAPTVDAEVIGALEDQLWSQLRPMMGRQGRKKPGSGCEWTLVGSSCS